MPDHRLISFVLCPYVQRSVVTLLEKDVPFDVEYVDLSNKPDWFLELSPLGKVPALVVREGEEEVVLFESVVINEYLDEATEGRLLPEAPLPRARARAWIEMGNAVLGDVFGVTSAKDEEALAKVCAKLDRKLERLEKEIDPGPYFLGADFSLVDAAFVPALQRLYWANELHPALASFEGRPRLERWWRAIEERPSVRGSVPEGFRARFEAMIGRDRGGYKSVVGSKVTAG